MAAMVPLYHALIVTCTVAVAAGQSDRKPFHQSPEGLGPRVISLSSADGQVWSLTGRGPRGDIDSTPALVPGDINNDMLRAGRLGVENLWYSDNAREAPWWVPVTEWTYETAIYVPASVGNDGPPGLGLLAALRFDGCDYNCSVSLDGSPLGNHRGSFVGFEYDATAIMSQAANNGRDTIPLRVVMHVPPNFEDFSVSSVYNGSKQFPLQMYGTEKCAENRLFTMWKGQMNRWDFAPPFWQLGLWRNVSLVLREPADIAFAHNALIVRTESIQLSNGQRGEVGWQKLGKSALLNISAALQATGIGGSFGSVELSIEWEVTCLTDVSAPAANIRTNHSIELIGKRQTITVDTVLEMHAPRLWWPNGYGEQHMYQLKGSIITSDAEPSAIEKVADIAVQKFGVRHLKNIRNPHPTWWITNQYEHGSACNGPCHLNSSSYPQGPRSVDDYYEPDRWQFVINGVKVFARGGNWVPGDMAYGALVHDQQRYRRLLRAAQLAGYTYMRIWGGGNIEDQSFYALCDEFGIMLQQDFPAAGCGYTTLNATGGNTGSLSWAWIQHPVVADEPSLVEGYKLQIPLITQQLISHPSVVRYTLGNEFYANRTWCPVQALFEDTLLALDNSRMARQADPTNVGQRHGPYVFDILGGSGYDCWGGRWPLVGSCDASNYRTEECCPMHLGNNTDQPGCRYTFAADSGPGDPFEWSEGGAVGISDLRTLKQILPVSSLTPETVGDEQWGFHKAGTGPQGGGMWLDEAGWAPLFVNGSAKDMGSIVNVVRASQFAQAEAYRFIYQSSRRKKPHRSLLATWTYDEPWPNAEHGSILDYYGRPKMAYYAVKQACKMVDISLSYSDVWTRPGEALRISLWIDNEFPQEITDFTYRIEFFDITGGTVAPTVQATGQLVLSPSSNLRVSEFAPPVISHDQPEGTVVIIRTSLVNEIDERLTVTHEYTFAVANARPVAPFSSLLSAPAINLTVTTFNNSVTVSSAPVATTCAVFVKLILQFKNGTDVPYAVFARNHFWMKPTELVNVLIEQGGQECAGSACEVCAQAWNSPLPICAELRP